MHTYYTYSVHGRFTLTDLTHAQLTTLPNDQVSVPQKTNPVASDWSNI